MNILWLIGSLHPALGGPVVAIKQLVLALQENGHSCELLTLDSAGDPGVSDSPGVVHALGPGWGKYRFNTRLLPWLVTNANRFDVIIVSGIWQYHGFATLLASKKVPIHYFVFTHGMLDPWFKVAYPMKHLKKWLYWLLAEYWVLGNATGVLFTSEDEKNLAPKSFWLYKANELVTNYGISLPSGNSDLQCQKFLDKFSGLRGKRMLLFLSRIHHKKGCDLLIEAFAQIANQDSDLQLVIAGPDEEGWQSKLLKRASQLGIAERITWTGMLSNDIKWGAYLVADAFILPSHSENFGLVVAEALACSLPVLITDKVNIWHGIKEDNAGIVESDTLDGTVRLLEKWLHLSPDEQSTMRTNALRCFLNRYEITATSKKLIEEIRHCIENDSRDSIKNREQQC